MISFIELRNELLENFDSLEKNDILLLEGKMIFPDKAKSNTVKKYLEEKFSNTHTVVETTPRSWSHWTQEYQSELYLKELQ